MRTIAVWLLAACGCWAVAGCPGKKDTAEKAATKPAAAEPARSEPAAKGLEAALTAGDAEAALQRIDARQQGAYRAAFQADKALMGRVGKLLGTRKLVRERGRLAEYEVTEGGKSYTAVFELRGGRWVLASL